jgi:6,7-dimethyl-8-ribityllumazine synthase
MTPTRYAFVKANWHAEIVDQALAGFRAAIGPDVEVEVFDVPGAFEIPLMARDLARTGRFAAVIGAALVVDGGIYRHDFVGGIVVEALMRAQMEVGVPILSVVLTPHNYQETAAHTGFFRAHFAQKGREAAEAAMAIVQARAGLGAA